MNPEAPAPAPIARRKPKRDAPRRTRSEPARWAAENRQLQAQKFQALNQLAGGVAHQFNNIIAGILGSAELLAFVLPENHPDHETLKQIFEACNQARDFNHRLGAFSQRPPPEFKPIRLQPVIEECLQILRTIIPPRVEIEAHIRDECPPVNADATQLHQAILDLCLHAWQGFGDRRGQIKITLENHLLVGPTADATRALPPGPYLRLTVQDNGPGLAKSACEQIFQPFRFRRAGGTKVGLELFLVRETIRGHRGEIFLETEPGHGLTFQIYLPVAGKVD